MAINTVARDGDAAPDGGICPLCAQPFPEDGCRNITRAFQAAAFLRARGWRELPDGSAVSEPSCVGLATALAAETLQLGGVGTALARGLPIDPGLYENDDRRSAA